jgi:hypothetical protein
MVKPRPTANRPGKTKSSRHRNGLQARRAIRHAVALVDMVCALSGDDELIWNPDSDETRQIRKAIKARDTPTLFAALFEAFSYQGISDHAAWVYMERHGRVNWHEDRLGCRSWLRSANRVKLADPRRVSPLPL